MAKWGNPWGSGNLWGVLTGANMALLCELAKTSRPLVQMDDTVGNNDFRELMCIFAEPFGHFADVVDDVAAAFNLNTAVGEQQDFIGSVIGLQRSGLDDDFYRTALQVQAEILMGQTDGDWTGSVNGILTMIRTFIGDGVAQPIVYESVPPYAFTIDIPGSLTTVQINVLFRLLCRALYAGVLGYFVVEVPGDNLWDSDHGAATNSGTWCSAHGATATTCAVWSYVVTTDICF